jgi:enamine deaminase RidA (YjgF/YER057c/UK114 family)
MRSAGSQRESVYEVWEATFPDPADKPAFKVVEAPLPEGVHFRLDFLALLGRRRTRIDIPGVDARDPTVRIGPWLFTSRLHGTSPETGQTVDGLRAQAKQALANGISLVELSGGSRADVTEICGFGRDLSYVDELRGAIDAEFAARDVKPGFHPIVTFIRPELELMVEVTAWIASA